MPLDIAIQLLLALIDRAGTISTLIQQAKASGSDTLTADQWAGIITADDAARAALTKALLDITPPAGG